MTKSDDKLGLTLQPGDNHYRAYVGPPKDYDLISAMVFNLLTCIGLRQHHRVLDIGCGSLRVGRLLIPYLNPEGYIGIEPNQWLVDDSIQNETGNDLLRIKKPVFSFKDSLEDFDKPLALDFAFAQSIFSHCGTDLIEQWLAQVSFHLKDNGVFLATFLTDEEDCSEKGWIYPECVSYKPTTLAEIAHTYHLHFEIIDWAHPRQTWAIFSKPDYDRKFITGDSISWNHLFSKM